ncbi:Glycerol kinase [Umbelopsis sp. WA50703]
MLSQRKNSDKVFIGSIDQGTTSTRFLIFDNDGKLITSHQLEFDQIYPRPGWIEHDPMDLVKSVNKCIVEAVRKFEMMGYDVQAIKTVGVTNQRETVLVWDRNTGKALYNALVWCDTRTAPTVKKLKAKEGSDKVGHLSGLPLATYFAGVKVRWLIENVPEVRDAIEEKRAMLGTVDSWLLYNLTGGKDGGVHVTDMSNASRTMFMNLETQTWDDWLLEFFDVPSYILPKIVSSSEHYGDIASGPLKGTPIQGCLGDQQAAMVGQKCFSEGQAKCTYGTGAFLLFNTGKSHVTSKNGLLSTICYKLGPDAPVVYALEGSVAVAGSAVKWLQNNIGLIKNEKDIGKLAAQVEDTGGVYFVTALSGLFAPYWRDDARGTIVGLTNFTNKRHIARATLEAVCFSTRAIIDAMKNDALVPLKILKVDGGLSNADTAMQIQSDVLGIEVERPAMRETTALGAAFAAGLAAGIWKSTDELINLTVNAHDTFEPKIDEKRRNKKYKEWEAAVERSYDWTRVVGTDRHEDDEDEN